MDTFPRKVQEFTIVGLMHVRTHCPPMEIQKSQQSDGQMHQLMLWAEQRMSLNCGHFKLGKQSWSAVSDAWAWDNGLAT